MSVTTDMKTEYLKWTNFHLAKISNDETPKTVKVALESIIDPSKSLDVELSLDLAERVQKIKVYHDTSGFKEAIVEKILAKINAIDVNIKFFALPAEFPVISEDMAYFSEFQAKTNEKGLNLNELAQAVAIGKKLSSELEKCSLGYDFCFDKMENNFDLETLDFESDCVDQIDQGSSKSEIQRTRRRE